MSREDLLSLVIVNYNAGRAIADCLETVVARLDIRTDIVVVDNASTDRSLDEIRRRFPMVTTIASTANLGYAQANNRGIAATRGNWIGLLNPDTLVPPNAFGRMVDYLAAHPKVAAVSPVLRWPDGVAQPFSHGDDPSPLYLPLRAFARARGRALHQWEGGAIRFVDWVSGACLVGRREAFEQVGDLDSRFFMYFEDTDWCRRCRLAGWAIAFLPNVSVTHLSRPDRADVKRREIYRQSLKYFYRKHYGALATYGLTLALTFAR